MQGVLYLVPNTLGSLNTTGTIPAGITEKVSSINVFIVENLRNARRYLKKLNHEIDIDQLIFHELNEHTPEEEIPTFLKQALNGSDTAIISEAGVPGVADPGAAVVRLAHEHGIRVVPLTGPSSILLSLMASGLNGQAFRFLGYLPVKSPDRIRKIREIEQTAVRKGETQPGSGSKEGARAHRSPKLQGRERSGEHGSRGREAPGGGRPAPDPH